MGKPDKNPQQAEGQEELSWGKDNARPHWKETSSLGVAQRGLLRDQLEFHTNFIFGPRQFILPETGGGTSAIAFLGTIFHCR